LTSLKLIFPIGVVEEMFFAVPVNMKQCCLAPESLPALPVILLANVILFA
jgi:hypothetical protein